MTGTASVLARPGFARNHPASYSDMSACLCADLFPKSMNVVGERLMRAARGRPMQNAGFEHDFQRACVEHARAVSGQPFRYGNRPLKTCEHGRGSGGGRVDSMP